VEPSLKFLFQFEPRSPMKSFETFDSRPLSIPFELPRQHASHSRRLLLAFASRMLQTSNHGKCFILY
jgi:hypothetical protein